MAVFTHLTDGLIYLNRATQEALKSDRPFLSRRASTRTPHGIYGEIYPKSLSKSQARRRLGLSEDGFLFVCPGDIKPYKNPTSLIEAVVGARHRSLRVVLAGRCDPPQYASVVLTAINTATARGATIKWIDHRLSNDEIALVIDAADVVVLPYGRSWNSGLAVLALERRRRLLCSGTAHFREIAEELGPYWVSIADHGIEAATLDKLPKLAVTVADEAALDQFIAERRWPEIASQTRSFYHLLLKKRRDCSV